jgi:hypothetical protein
VSKPYARSDETSALLREPAQPLGVIVRVLAARS